MLALDQTKNLEQLLDEARNRIEVADAELTEARRRRSAIASVLRTEFPGCRVYVNGSIAHGDALTPLSDVDLGVVVPDPDGEFGPGKKGPTVLKERAAAAIRTGLKEAYGDLAVYVEGRKRSILIRFRNPVSPGLPDFTADVIVAVDNPSAAGLYIPRYSGWDRSHPERHTELVLNANEVSRATYARTVRLLKHWNRSNGKPLCSWNIKALALTCLDCPATPMSGMCCWFEHAIERLAIEETPDPAGVAVNPIKLNEKMTRTEVVRRLRRAQEGLARAAAYERDGYPFLAHNELAKFFNDEQMLPAPSPIDVLSEEARRVNDRKKVDSKAYGGPALLSGTGISAGQTRINARSWGIG